MLQITIPSVERFDERTNEFVSIKGQTLQLEHSLVSLSKWESKWHIPFLGNEDKTFEQTIDYIRCMTITQNVNPSVFDGLTNEIIMKVTDYINDSMTATWFTEEKKKTNSKEVITAELIYYWMIALNIPMECQKWHLNRLITLIKVCSIKQEPEKKMSKKDLMARNRALNAARKSKLNSRG